MTGSVTHIVGPFIEIEGRVIQRCLVCGEKLLDSRGVSMQPGGRFACYEAGRMLRRCEDGRDYLLIDVPLPEDNCLALVEA